MNIYSEKQTGALKISEDVIVMIAANVIRETQGVYEYFALDPMGIFKTPSISARFNNGTVEVTALVNLGYGVKAQAAVESVQKNIKNSIQDMTGIIVSKVNVKIASLV